MFLTPVSRPAHTPNVLTVSTLGLGLISGILLSGVKILLLELATPTLERLALVKLGAYLLMPFATTTLLESSSVS